jgi:hypothetical protein
VRDEEIGIPQQILIETPLDALGDGLITHKANEYKDQRDDQTVGPAQFETKTPEIHDS